MPNGADTLALEQERKRELYRQRQKAALGKAAPPGVGGTISERELSPTMKAKSVEETKVVGQVPAGVAVGRPAGKVTGKKAAVAMIRGGVSGLAEMAAQFGGEQLLRILWGSLLGIITFIPCLLGLNLYAAASSGILDGIFPVSKKIAPFGLFNKFLPGALGKWFGIIALGFLDLFVLAITITVLAFIAFLVWFFVKAGWVEVLGYWLKNIFSGLGS